MSLRVVTPPAAYPVTLLEAKAWARIDEEDDTQDGPLMTMISAAANTAQHLTGRAFVERQLEWAREYDEYCCRDWYRDGYLKLPLPPLLSIDYVRYTDQDRVEQTIDAEQYEVDPYSEPGRLRFLTGFTWPRIGRFFNPFRIGYRAGYRPSASPTDLTNNEYLPGELRLWLMTRISTFNEFREQIISGTIVNELPPSVVDRLLDPLVMGTRLF